MSQNDAESSESMKGATKLMSTEKDEKEEQKTEIEIKRGSNAKNCQAEGVASCSKLQRKGADVDTDGDKQNEEQDKNIQLVFLPEVTYSSEFGYDGDYDGDKDDDESEFYIRFLFNPELHDDILNEDVIAEIGKFLDFEDLQSLRRVNKLWSAGVTPTFLRKSIIVLWSEGRSEAELEALEQWTKDFKGLPSLKIKLVWDFKFEQEREMFIHILANLSPTLKTLEVQFWLDHILLFQPQPSFQLPVLTSLTIDNEEKQPHFFQFIYASAPNLTELGVGYFYPHSLSPLLTEDGCRNWALAPKLKCLKVFHQIPTKDLSTLIKFPQTWESLEMFVDGTDLESLGVLFEKNKDCLVRLKLTVELSAEFCFPKTFSKLQKLELNFMYYMENGLNFEESDLNYSQMFPNLTSLSLEFDIWYGWRSISQIWRELFPPQVFKGLQCLELRLSCDYAQFLRDEGIDGDWAQTMFPNARIVIKNLT